MDSTTNHCEIDDSFQAGGPKSVSSELRPEDSNEINTSVDLVNFGDPSTLNSQIEVLEPISQTCDDDTLTLNEVQDYSAEYLESSDIDNLSLVDSTTDHCEPKR